MAILKVDAPFFFFGTRPWCMASIVERRWQIFIPDQLCAPPFHDLVQVGRFGEWTECDERLAVDPRDAESGAELDLRDTDAGSAEP